MSQVKHTFFCADLNYGLLNEDESIHANRVLRLKIGDEIRVVNGRGRAVIARITSTGKKEVGYEIQHEIDNDVHPLHVHIAIAPTKNIDRFTFFLEKVTELGCHEVSPIYTTNSERKILKTEKLKKGMISALKQSGNLFLPRLNEPVDYKDFLAKNHREEVKLIAHCEEDETKVRLQDKLQKGKDVLILIGPEGDFTPEEVILAKENSYSGVTLGNGRFRTETAGILACHTAYLFL
ncbi:MAG: 16S rRNA (uracil(1498)-N(3))-methyltransferase [Crocinitomicaceae bacterium]|nr:16S rRNA (uracil(1498)-N(3))-methyltransferase [Crocinitomicaceae bacterium]